MKDSEFVNEIYRLLRLNQNAEMKDVIDILERYEREFEYDWEMYDDD